MNSPLRSSVPSAVFAFTTEVTEERRGLGFHVKFLCALSVLCGL